MIQLVMKLSLFLLASSFVANAFVPMVPDACPIGRQAPSALDATLDSSASTANALLDARQLLDLHESEATFDFCGGMMFQLELTDALVEHLRRVEQSSDDEQPVVHSQIMRMAQVEGYTKSAFADNTQYFHGREIRNVPHAKGGMGMVLQLSLAHSDAAERGDPQGWSREEMETYNGWMSDRNRVWRNGKDYEGEGFSNFREKYGPQAYGLNHRFYFHSDGQGRLWLSAEDGCEGTPSSRSQNNPLESMFKSFFRETT